MKISLIEPQKKNKNRFSVYIDGSFSFGIDEFDLLRLKLCEGRELSCDELAQIKQETVFSKAKDYAIRLTASRMYTEQAVRRKLYEREYGDDIADDVINFLKEYGFINDETYAREFINECLNIKKIGKFKIKNDLILRGIPKDVADEALSEFDFSEIEINNLLPLMEKKLGGDFSYKNVIKTKKYFASRGYSFDVIDRAAKRICVTTEDFFEC